MVQLLLDIDGILSTLKWLDKIISLFVVVALCFTHKISKFWMKYWLHHHTSQTRLILMEADPGKMGCGCLGEWLTWESYCPLDALTQNATWAFSIEKHWTCNGHRSRTKLAAQLFDSSPGLVQAFFSVRPQLLYFQRVTHVISNVNYHPSNWWNVPG